MLGRYQKTHFMLGVLASHANRIEANKQSWLSHGLDMSYNLCLLASSMGITITHEYDLWDYAGVLDSTKEVKRTDDYIFKKVLRVDVNPLNHETFAYGFEIEEAGTLCLETSLISGIIH